MSENHNLISKSEAVMRLRNVSNRIGLAISALNKDGDWQGAFDFTYEAADMLPKLMEYLDEVVKVTPKPKPQKPAWDKPEPEPPGSLKYGQPLGEKERTGKGAFGYAGKTRHPHNYSSANNAPPPVIKVERVETAKPRVFNMGPATPVVEAEFVDTTPPEPIIFTPPPPKPVFKVGDYATAAGFGEALQIYRIGDGWAFFASLPRPVHVDQLTSASAPALPDGAEVVTFDIDRMSGLYGGALDTEMYSRLDAMPAAFRQTVLKTHALTHRPVTVWRVGEGEWRIK